MTYILVNDGIPTNGRPVGINNLNQLVSSQIGLSSYEVIASLQSNLPLIQAVYNELKNIQTLGLNTLAVQVIGQNIDTLKVIACSLPALQSILDNLDNITNVNKNININNENLKKIKSDLDILNSQISQDALNTLLKKYENLQELLTKIEEKLVKTEQIITNQDKLNKELLHLKASEAVDIALTSKLVIDINSAKEAILSSEKQNNDEYYNKTRLGKLDD